jgi:hypothetical protein
MSALFHMQLRSDVTRRMGEAVLFLKNYKNKYAKVKVN